MEVKSSSTSSSNNSSGIYKYFSFGLNDISPDEEELLLLNQSSSPRPLELLSTKPRNKYRGYALTSFILFSMIMFILLIKLADASTEYNNLENMDQWTKESLIGLSVIAAFCLILGCLLIFVSKHRAEYYNHGYQEI